MRRIEIEMVSAMCSGKNWQQGNTAVVHTGDTCTVLLHGHVISIFTGGNLHSLSMAGWPTVTTRSRINALLGRRGSLCQRDGEQVLTWGGRTAPICEDATILLDNWSKYREESHSDAK